MFTFFYFMETIFIVTILFLKYIWNTKCITHTFYKIRYYQAQNPEEKQTFMTIKHKYLDFLKIGSSDFEKNLLKCKIYKLE